MRITLQVTAGPEKGRKVYLQQGQTARFGRTEWADFSFPKDKQLADEHFLLDYGRTNLKLKALGADRIVKVNGAPVAEIQLNHGDNIEAGETTLQVLFAGQPMPISPAAAAAAAAALAASAEEAEKNKVRLPIHLCEELEFGDDEADLANTCTTDPEWIDKLAANQKFSSALRVQAFLLPQREAVWWAAQMVDQTMGAKLKPADAAAYAAGLAWALDPNEDYRRDAERAAAKTKCDGPGSWVALAAFWSGDSIAPVEIDPVKPDHRLTSQAVATAMVISAYQEKSAPPATRFARYLAVGRDIQEGKLKMPTEPAKPTK